MGLVDLGQVNDESAAYIAGYVVKKMTSKDDPRLEGRHPEFSRMSKQSGGLGAAMMDEVASTLMDFDLEKNMADVPSALRHGGKLMPLGRYLRQRLRTRVGMDAKAPQSTLDEMAERLRPLRETAFENSESFKKTVIAAADQKVLQMETKQKIFKERKKL